MKRLMIASGLCLMASLAHAADKAGPPVVGSPAFGELAAAPAKGASPFTGLYTAVILGAGLATLQDAQSKLASEGGLGGAALGYRYHLAAPGVVLGVEGDYTLSAVKGSLGDGIVSVQGSTKALASLRAVAGLPYHHALIYVTGGPAWSLQRLEAGNEASNRRPQGWAVGGGIEAAVLGNLGVRVEALRYIWPKETYTLGGESAALDAATTVVRAGVVIRLN